VMRLLGGRKACRDFNSAVAHGGLPKSSLDGMRDTVLRGPAKNEDPQTYRNSWSKATRRKLRVRIGEQLDVVGVVKRAADGTKPYPSVSRVAADPWIRGHEGRLGSVIAACQLLGKAVIRELNVSERGHPHHAGFPFEGTAVFRNRYHELIEEADLGLEELRPLADAVARLGEPNPYLAVIVADGDKMGKTISRLRSADEHRQFSATIAEFAAKARSIVHEHNGILIYAGGDDVLAFAPVDKCLDCARALHFEFGVLLNDWHEKDARKITLSVGIAIGHFMENLEDLLESGRAAEKNAKQPDRDGLAVHLHKRGGSPVRVRMAWTTNPVERLKANAQLFVDQAIPSRLPYELRRMADVYANEHWPTATLGEAIRLDVLRVIAKKQPGGGGSVRDRLQPLLANVSSAESLRRVAEELLIARQIATACRQAAGHGNGEDQ
jgi:CRISPR-associated protein Cmr2